MNPFTINLMLALLWAALQSFTPVDLIVGFLLGYVIIFMTRRWLGEGAYRYVRRVPLFLKFFLYYCLEVVVSTLQVTLLIFRDEKTLKPGIIALPLDAETELEAMLFHTTLVIIPGTMSVALSPDHKTLYIHIIDMPDADKMREKLKEGERRLLEVIR